MYEDSNWLAVGPYAAPLLTGIHQRQQRTPEGAVEAVPAAAGEVGVSAP